MANANAPQGLVPIKYLNGSDYNGQMRIYFIPSTDANAYAIGDPVGTLTGAADTNGISAVTIGVAGSSAVMRGVIRTAGGTVAEAGYYDPTNLNTVVIPASKTKGYYVGVVDDPNVIFEGQEFSSTGSTNFTAADIGKGCNLKAGTNNGYISQWVLDDTAASSTSSTRQVRLLGLSRRKNNAFGNYAKFEVLFNQHELKAATAGV